MKIEGILPALFTPFDDRGRVHPPAIDKLVDWYFAGGCQGTYVCGTTGEGILLTLEERRTVAERAIEAVASRGPVIVHVGSLNTGDAVKLAKHAESIQATAVAAMPPFAFGKDLASMKDYFRAIADATKLPLYLYHIPSLIGISLTVDMVQSLLEIPTVRGMKFSDADLFTEYRMATLADRFTVLHGCDETLLHALMMGAVGGVGLTYNFLPAFSVEIFQECKQGSYGRANQLQLQLAHFTKIYHAHAQGNPIGLGKALMHSLGIDCGSGRAPNRPFPDSVLREFLARVRELDVLPKTDRAPASI